MAGRIEEIKIKVKGEKIEVSEKPEKPEGEEIGPCDLKLGDLRRRTIDVLVTMLRENRLSDPRELKVLGENLYSVLLDNDIGKELNQALHAASKYLRVELQFETNDHGIAGWPWEYLYCPRSGGYFLASEVKLILSRMVKLDLPPRDLIIVKPPRVLFIASSPDPESNDPKDKLSKVEFQRLLEELQSLAGKNIIKLGTLLPSMQDSQLPTLPNFYAHVEAFDPHIIHFIGHGRCKADHGEIAFTDTNGKPRWVADEELARYVVSGQSVKLVFLQACESALPGPYQAVSGCAMKIAHRNIPAVVAMQYEIENMVANLFARTFYSALAELEPFDLAVQKGRLAIQLQYREEAEKRSFGLPVLYLRRSGATFEQAVSQAVVAGSSTSVATPGPAPSQAASVVTAPSPAPMQPTMVVDNLERKAERLPQDFVAAGTIG